MDINEAWKSTCKVLLGDEIGELERYRKYLLKHTGLSLAEAPSQLSGKKVTVASSRLHGNAKFIGNDEIGQYNRLLADNLRLNVNAIKDFDSILEALNEKMYYCGSIVLGNSSDVQKSTACSDSSCVYESYLIRNGAKYVGFSNRMRECEFTFGSADGGETKFLIKGYAPYRNTRCMEILRSKPASDCYYAAGLQGCSNCMFSFNLRNRNFMIGNLELPKDAYAKLKEKLVGDIRQTLSDKKEVPTIVDILAECREGEEQRIEAGGGSAGSEPGNLVVVQNGFSQIENAFQSTTLVVLGRALTNLKEYGEWLEGYSIPVRKTRSAVSREIIDVPDFLYYCPIRKALVGLAESLELGKKNLAREDLEGLRLGTACGKLRPIAYFSPVVSVGRNLNVIDCGDYQNTSNAFRGSFVFDSKNIACSFFSKLCNNVFGSNMLLSCTYCIRCSDSAKLARCFEVSDSENCTDCYFCHNCEGLSNCMFCFNAKSLRYAIGNREVGREEYMRIRKIVLDEIAKRLEKDKKLGISIYNLGHDAQSPEGGAGFQRPGFLETRAPE